MSTVLTHVFVSAAATRTVMGAGASRRTYLLAAICSVAADLDVVGLRLGIPYEHMLGHRGLSHSVAFAVVLSLAVLLVGGRGVRISSRRWWGLWALLAAIALSHGLLDAVTNGGLGVAAWAPFSNARHFLPYRPLVVSPIGLAHMFSPWGATVILSELLWVWAPLTACLLVAEGVRAALAHDEPSDNDA
ncbi:MAG TPA: metal-dependent hydrolase [Phycisphaerae bacterium]|nr:metal-dependent hydrolase [Phycisphaerae bacterium]